mmetsp:Transcript_3283/g.9135  ORF Transcript_3283/g.9135 Transcript_3283/m.9135 type:complete len:210 (+) Transcript_3283:2077-2706(+)
MPAKSARDRMNLGSSPIAVIFAGANWKPSVNKATGRSRTADIIVITLKRLMLSSFSPLLPVMNFLLSTFLLWKVRLLPIAAPNPAQLKLASVALARATPPTIGTSVSSTGRGLDSPRKMEDRATEKKGSMALMVCVKLTATFPRLTLVSRFPRVWTHARGRIVINWLLVSLGLLWIPVAHTKRARQEPTTNWSSVQDTGNLNTLSTCLL